MMAEIQDDPILRRLYALSEKEVVYIDGGASETNRYETVDGEPMAVVAPWKAIVTGECTGWRIDEGFHHKTVEVRIAGYGWVDASKVRLATEAEVPPMPLPRDLVDGVVHVQAPRSFDWFKMLTVAAQVVTGAAVVVLVLAAVFGGNEFLEDWAWNAIYAGICLTVGAWAGRWAERKADRR